MKKIILRSSYFLYLLCFNILVSSLLFWLGESVLGNLEISGDAYFGIGYLVLALLNVFLSYFAEKMSRRGSNETAERNAEKGIYGGDLRTIGPLTLRRW